MGTNIIGAKAQKPVSAMEKTFIESYGADMADAFAIEWLEFDNLSDVEKLEWIKTNDATAYDYFFTHKERFA